VRDRNKKGGYIFNKELGQYAQSNSNAMQLYNANTKVVQKPRDKSITPIVESNASVTQKYDNDL